MREVRRALILKSARTVHDQPVCRQSPPRGATLAELDARARDIFRRIVETYLETGEPVGSRTISRGGVHLSPASIRNTMQDLTELGLLGAPHISAGRMPTHAGLRLFVDGLLEVGDLAEERSARHRGAPLRPRPLDSRTR